MKRTGSTGFARAAGSDKNSFAGHIVTPVEDIQDGLHKVLSLRQATFAEHATGEVAAVRGGDGGSAKTQGFKIGLRSRVLPHLHIHGGGQNQRRRRGKCHGGQKIVGHAVGQPGKDVGSRRRDNQGLGRLRFRDMFDGRVSVGNLAVAIPKAGNDAMPGQCLRRSEG